MLDAQVKLRFVNRKTTSVAGRLEQEYQQLRRQLAQVGLISAGSVQDRTARQGGGAGYQWTRKVAQKTVTVALTAQEFARMKEAVSNYRRLRQQLTKMEQLSRRIIFQTAPHPRRLKRLSQKVLGTI
jgi:hypothetical protein